MFCIHCWMVKYLDSLPGPCYGRDDGTKFFIHAIYWYKERLRAQI